MVQASILLKDNSALYSYLTGLDHLKFIAHAQGLPSSRIDEGCPKVGITSYVNKKQLAIPWN